MEIPLVSPSSGLGTYLERAFNQIFQENETAQEYKVHKVQEKYKLKIL